MIAKLMTRLISDICSSASNLIDGINHIHVNLSPCSTMSESVLGTDVRPSGRMLLHFTEEVTSIQRE